jgi:hypothetical protein
MSRNDLDSLLSSVIPFAKQMLDEHGRFNPFGSVMKTGGEIALVGGYDDKSDAAEIANLLVEGFRGGARSGDYMATALCVDVRVNPPDGSGTTDAIRVTLEDAAGEAVNVFLPYRKRAFRGIKYGELFGSQAERSVFV